MTSRAVNSSNANNRRRRRVAWSASVVEDYGGAEDAALDGLEEYSNASTSSVSSGSDNDFYDDDLVVAHRVSHKSKSAAGSSASGPSNGPLPSSVSQSKLEFVNEVMMQVRLHWTPACLHINCV
jgi:hypothetical protein